MDDESHQFHKNHIDKTLEVDDDGWLQGPDVTITPSRRDQALWPNETNILGIVWHYTDTRNAGAAALARRIMAPPTNGQRAASWHLCIDRTGAMVQSVSARRGSWHAGGATAARFQARLVEAPDREWRRQWEIASVGHGRPTANDLFFGVELENVGEVRLRDGEWLGWPFKRGDKALGEPIAVPADEVSMPMDAGIGHWHAFTKAQYFAAERVVECLARRYHLIEQNCRWTHAQIDPRRRTDPGPLWVENGFPVALGCFGAD